MVLFSPDQDIRLVKRVVGLPGDLVELRGDAHSYAVALAALEQNRVEQTWQACDTAVAATGGNLLKRIKRLLYPKAPSGIWAPALAAVVLIASAAVVLSAWQ